MKLKLIKSVKKDLSVIAKIYQTEMSKPPYNESWTFKKAMSNIRFFSKFYDLYTIKADDKIVGFICINPIFMCPGEVALGEEMSIKEEFQSRGIGTWVLGQIFKIYKKKGFKRFMGIAESGGRAIKLYKRLKISPSKKYVLIERRFK